MDRQPGANLKSLSGTGGSDEVCVSEAYMSDAK